MKCRSVSLFIAISMVVSGMFASLVAASSKSPEITSEENMESVQAATDKLAIFVTFLNPVTGEPMTVFHPGHKVLYQVKAVIPSAAEDKKATLTITGSLTVNGIDVPFNLSNTVSGPISNPTGEAIELPFSKTWKGSFKIPAKAPACVLKFNAALDVETVGSVVVKKTLTVKK
jgi:hypothetical protein